jgi:hypothetical protein
LTHVKDILARSFDHGACHHTGTVMQDQIERLHAYLNALDHARQSVDEARRLFPDMDLDHAVDRLAAFVKEGAQRLHAAEAGLSEGDGPVVTSSTQVPLRITA